MSNLTIDYLMWHHFGRNLDQYSPDLINSYKQYFAKLPHPKNLAGFIESYIKLFFSCIIIRNCTIKI